MPRKIEISTSEPEPCVSSEAVSSLAPPIQPCVGSEANTVIKPKRQITDAQREHLNKIRELAMQKKKELKEITLKSKLAKTVPKQELAAQYDNYIAQNQIQNVTMSERFSPLFGIDATWIIKSKGKEQGLLTKFEIKKDRSITLSLNNNQITEVLGNEWVIGSGYKFTQVKLPIKKVKASDVNLRFDFSLRDNLTVIRKVVENTNQATAGQRVMSIKTSADYNLNQNLTLQFYYDHIINTPKIASSYPTGNLSTGIRLRFNLGGIQ